MCSPRRNRGQLALNPSITIATDILNHLCHRTKQIENTDNDLGKVIARYFDTDNPIDKEALGIEWEALCDKVDETIQTYREELNRVTEDVLTGVMRAGGYPENEAREYSKTELSRHNDYLEESVWINKQHRHELKMERLSEQMMHDMRESRGRGSGPRRGRGRGRRP